VPYFCFVAYFILNRAHLNKCEGLEDEIMVSNKITLSSETKVVLLQGQFGDLKVIFVLFETFDIYCNCTIVWID